MHIKNEKSEMASSITIFFADCRYKEKRGLKKLCTLYISVQAEFFLLPAPTFLEGLYLNFHMPGHFFLYEVVYAYPLGPLARLHKNRTKRL